MLRKICIGGLLLAGATSSAWGAITLNASGGNGQVSLNWSYSGSTATTQEIYRDLDSNPNGRVRIASVSASTRSYVDTGVSGGTTYYYWIKNTVNGVAENSNTASATPSGSGGGGSITGSSCGTSGAQTTVNETIR